VYSIASAIIRVHEISSSSSSSGHEIGPINDLLLPHDFIRLLVSLFKGRPGLLLTGR
jgi:hypothetical protein